MGWLDRLRRSPREPAETTRCTFCRRSRSEVGALIAGPGVSICDECVVTVAAFDKPSHDGVLVWASLLSAMARQEVPAVPPHQLEVIVAAACAVLGDDEDAIRELGDSLLVNETVAYARARIAMYSAIAPAKRTAGDAVGLLIAALLVGDFELARRAVPADPEEREQPMRQLDELLVPLLLARPGDPEALVMAARVHALAPRVIEPDEAHLVVLSTYRGLADQRSGKAASAVAHYAPHVEHECMWPWHRMVLVEAYRATGDEAAARAVLTGVAERVGGSEYWRELAAQQLQSTPYR